MIRIARQPNGKYFIEYEGQRYINQTEEDYYDFVFDNARKALATPGYVEGVDSVIKRLTSDEEAKEMGFDKPVKELLKWIPKEPVNPNYYGRDCTAYANCPTCGNGVSNGIGGKDEICPKCGQRLKWSRY